MKISIASDHAGFDLKNFLVEELRKLGHEVLDHGAHELKPEDDYPQYISKVAKEISDYEEAKLNGYDSSHTVLGEEKGNRYQMGIVIGGSGQGEAILANKYPHIRAAVVYGGMAVGGSELLIEKITTLSREHNDANILSLGARFISESEALTAVKLWLETEFKHEDKYERRIKEVETLEKDI